jgi:hypothetical protein
MTKEKLGIDFLRNEATTPDAYAPEKKNGRASERAAAAFR